MNKNKIELPDNLKEIKEINNKVLRSDRELFIREVERTEKLQQEIERLKIENEILKQDVERLKSQNELLDVLYTKDFLDKLKLKELKEKE